VPISRRFSIQKIFSDKKTPVGKLTVFRSPAGSWEVQLGADSQEFVGEIRAIIAQEKAVLKSRSPGEATSAADLPETWPIFVLALEKNGFQLEPLPAADVSFNFEIDTNSGRILGWQQALHPFRGPSDDELGKRILESVSKGMTNAAAEVAEKIDAALAIGVFEAAKAVELSHDEGKFSFPATKGLLQALTRIDCSSLPERQRRIVRECRLLTAQRLKQFEVAGDDAEAMLADAGAAYSEQQKIDLRMTVALASAKKGNKETALTIWRDLLKSPRTLTAEQRAWAWRNLLQSLPIKDREFREAAKHSADAFLECGNKEEAVRSLIALVDALMFSEPAQAVKMLDDVLALLDAKGLRNVDLRAEVHRIRAHKLSDLAKHEEAFASAKEAVQLRRGILGAESLLISCLHLAAMEAQFLGLASESIALTAEADALAAVASSPHFRLTQRVKQLTDAFDADEAVHLIADAEAAKDYQVVAATTIIRTMLDKSISDTKRLELLEETARQLEHASINSKACQPTHLAIGALLLQMNQEARALHWFRKILDADPFDVLARNHLLHCLWQLGKWREAADFLQGQIDLRGQLPGLMHALGRSLFEAGDYSAAIPVLTKAASLVEGDDKKKISILEMREKAIEAGGTVARPVVKLEVAAPVTREEFDTALDAFASFIASDQRMGFWTKGEQSDYKWVERPERRAQDLLHTFLKGKLHDRISLFEEIATGAGRLDLFAQLHGGLSLIIELKMCGFGYSTTYAAAGEEQILHYMAMRQTKLGYLVVFDSRLDSFGEPLQQGPASDGYTVLTKFVDVRPRVRSTRRKPK
jgi:tetratricopeptide (TPR) repeat protein